MRRKFLRITIIIIALFSISIIAYATTQNAANQQYANNSDGFQIGGGSTARTLTVTGGNITLTGAGSGNTYTFPTSTDTIVGVSATQTLTNKTWNGITIGVPYGGTGATTLTGIVEGNGTSAMTTSSIITDTGTNVGISSTSPGQKLDVNGTVRMTGFQLGTSTTSGYVLTANASGLGSWAAASGGGSSQWTTTNIHDVYLPNNGNVGLGTTITNKAALTVMNGNVGIGTWVPAGLLDVNKEAFLVDGSTDGSTVINGVTGPTGIDRYFVVNSTGANAEVLFNTINSGSNQIVFSDSTGKAGPPPGTAPTALWSIGTNKGAYSDNRFVFYNQQTGNTDISLNPTTDEITLGNAGQSVVTTNNTLDSGSGDVTISGVVNDPNWTGAAGSLICVDGSGNLTTSGCSGGAFPDIIDSGGVVTLGNQTGGAVYTQDGILGNPGNTLDDGSGNAFLAEANILQDTYTNSDNGIENETNITTLNTQLTICNTGDTFGQECLHIANHSGLNGAQFDSTNSTIPVTDFAFLNTGGSSNIRLESRGEFYSDSVASPEMEIGPINTYGNPVLTLAADGSQNAAFDNDLTVYGKLNMNGGSDPPYVLLDPETQSQIIDEMDYEVPAEKRNGLTLFWDGKHLNGITVDTQGNGTVYQIQMTKVGSFKMPNNYNTQSQSIYYWDRRSKSVKTMILGVHDHSRDLPAGMIVDRATGKLSPKPKNK